MRMYKGDLKPDLTITCTNDGTPVNLTTATAIRIIGRKDGATLFDRAPSSSSLAAGVVSMLWQVADTATTGLIEVEVEVMWPGSKPQTFVPHTPAGVREGVQVHSDLA